MLGDHPDGGAISVKSGRFGPYVNFGKVNANVPKGTDPEALTLDEAIALIKARQNGEPSAGGGRRLGEHPQGGVITVREGRFGPYVNLGKVNANLPKDTALDSVTLRDAIELIDARGGPAAAPARKASASKAPAKKAAPASKPKVAVKDSARPPFAGGKAPAKKAAAKKAPAKKAATRKPAAKAKSAGRK